MDSYTIKFSEWAEPSPNGTAEFGILRVFAGSISFPVRVSMSRTLAAVLGYDNPDPAARSSMRQKMLKAAMPQFRVRLDEMEVPASSTDTFLHQINFNSEHAPVFRNEDDKSCQFQERQTRGLMCLAAAMDDEMEGKTSKALCAACNLPDDALRCTLLQHPAVVGSVSQESRERSCRDAFCDIKTDHFNVSKCAPGDHPCWRIAIEHQPAVINAPADVALQFIDELKYFDLSFDRAFGHRVVKVHDPRTVATLLGHCGSQQEFTFKVAAVADLFNSLDLTGLSPEIDPKTQGSFNRLGEYMKKKGVLADELPLKSLRWIVAIRNSFPIHSGNATFLNACRELGVQYPPMSWNDAWRAVIANAWSSLRALRLMLPG